MSNLYPLLMAPFFRSPRCRDTRASWPTAFTLESRFPG